MAGASRKTSEPWYADGLRFRCTQCGDCCTGAEGYVWVNQQEVEELAAARGMTPAVFERRFVKRVGIRRSLKERKGGDCVLLDADTRKCTVYDARPRQCRTWPSGIPISAVRRPGPKRRRPVLAAIKATSCRSSRLSSRRRRSGCSDNGSEALRRVLPAAVSQHAAGTTALENATVSPVRLHV